MNKPLNLADYRFTLPPELIAQHPTPARDAARLLHLDRKTGARAHMHVRDLPSLLRAGDLLVLNTTRVSHARLCGRKQSGGRAEALLVERAPDATFHALLRARGRRFIGEKFYFEHPARDETRTLNAELVALQPDGRAQLAFDADADPHAFGEVPLPPYIYRERSSRAAQPADRARYQTVYARERGSLAAPTAGLHLTHALLAALRARGVALCELVLHIGLGTFRPLDAATLEADALHAERYVLPDATARAIARTRRAGGRVLAVGTSTTRVLEHAHCGAGEVRAGAGVTRLFLRPGSAFHVVNGLLTNFHLPASSLLLLAAAFAGRAPLLSAYEDAIARGYRFYSYGDAMWIA